MIPYPGKSNVSHEDCIRIIRLDSNSLLPPAKLLDFPMLVMVGVEGVVVCFKAKEIEACEFNVNVTYSILYFWNNKEKKSLLPLMGCLMGFLSGEREKQNGDDGMVWVGLARMSLLPVKYLRFSSIHTPFPNDDTHTKSTPRV
ncbi:hypothetical protein DMENIID0001_124320 [Sergentomyia squamirostris]